MNFWLVVEPTPLKNMLVKMGSSSPNRGENKKCLKPPSSHEFCSNHEIHISWMVGRIEVTGWWEKTPPGFLFGAFGLCIFRGVRRLLLNFRWVPFFFQQLEIPWALGASPNWWKWTNGNGWTFRFPGVFLVFQKSPISHLECAEIPVGLDTVYISF